MRIFAGISRSRVVLAETSSRNANNFNFKFLGDTKPVLGRLFKASRAIGWVL